MTLDALRGARIGLCLTGSFCTLRKVFDGIPRLTAAGATLTPILSYSVDQMDTRFFPAAKVREILTELCGVAPIASIPEVEPIGPQKRFDLLIVAPCTGNTCAKLAAGIADTPVTLAVKSHLRNERPVLIAVSSNDGLAVNAKSLGTLLARKHMFFVPFEQDDPVQKPSSLVFDANQLAESANSALFGVQIQPLLFVNA